MMNENPIRLRQAEPSDAVAICEIYALICSETAISFETVAPDAETMRHRIRGVIDRYPWLVAVSDEAKVLGYAYASRHRERAAYRWSVDFTVYVAPTAKRKNIGTALYAALIGICRELGYHRAFAGITLPNDASVGLHEKMGFRPIGVYQRVGFKLGKWHDVGWWGLDLGPEPENPNEPIPVTALISSPVWGGDFEEIA